MQAKVLERAELQERVESIESVDPIGTSNCLSDSSRRLSRMRTDVRSALVNNCS